MSRFSFCLFLPFLVTVACLQNNLQASDVEDAVPVSVSEFSNPYGYITGAYFGLSFGVSKLGCNVESKFNERIYVSPDLSALESSGDVVVYNTYKVPASIILSKAIKTISGNKITYKHNDINGTTVKNYDVLVKEQNAQTAGNSNTSELSNPTQNDKNLVLWCYNKDKTNSISQFQARKFSISKGTPEFSLFAGFGHTFSRNYYTGLEIEFMKRFSCPEKTESPFMVSMFNNVAFNFNIRTGYAIPKNKCLLFLLFGFSQVRGSVTFSPQNHIGESTEKKTFGSLYPTIGCGIERLINHKWSCRLDVSYTFASKSEYRSTARSKLNPNDSDDKLANVVEHSTTYICQPKRCAVKFSLVRFI